MTKEPLPPLTVEEETNQVEDFSFLPDPPPRKFKISPKVRAAFVGEPPRPDFLQEGLDRDAWQRVLNRLQGKSGLLWEIFATLRSGREKMDKALASSVYPPSKKRRELKEICNGILSRTGLLQDMMKSASKEEKELYLDATKNLITASRSIIELLKVDVPAPSTRPKIKARHDFIHKTNKLLIKRLEGFTLENKEDFKLLVDICLTVGAIDIPADFPEDLKKTLIKQNIKVK